MKLRAQFDFGNGMIELSSDENSNGIIFLRVDGIDNPPIAFDSVEKGYQEFWKYVQHFTMSHGAISIHMLIEDGDNTYPAIKTIVEEMRGS